MGKKKKEAKQREVNNLIFLVGKSQKLLQDQISSYEDSKKISSIALPVLAFVFPMIIGFITTKDIQPWFLLILIIPIILISISGYHLYRNITPKDLKASFNQSNFEELIDKEESELLLFEINSNLTSIELNAELVDKQFFHYKKAMFYLILSAIIVLLAVLIMIINKNLVYLCI